MTDHATGAPDERRSDVGDMLRDLVTERPRPDLASLDVMSTRKLVGLLADEDATVPVAVARAGDAIAAAVEAIVRCLERGGRLIYVGAGTPGRLAVLDAAECQPTFGVPPGRIIAVMAGGDAAMTAAIEGAEDDQDAARQNLDALGIGADDVVVGITASGRTPYVLAAVAAARAAGAVTVGVTNNPDALLSGHVDHPIEVLTGPEVVAGSTRMKAGTAQKLVLNALSTVSMIRLGKTYGNLMVDVAATNEKLRHRARRIVIEATGVDEQRVGETLRAAGGHVKTAVVALLADVDVDEARARLDRANGHMRAALGEQAAR